VAVSGIPTGQLGAASPEDEDHLLRDGLVVLDDDPTGTQAIAGVPVVIDISGPGLAQAFAGKPTSIYVSTNTRAFPPDKVGARLGRIVASVREAWPNAHFVMRGDSTLRGHVGEEFLSVKDDATNTLVLVPAMPGAGRLTLDGEHYLVRGDVQQPVHLTEYGRDADFSYGTSNLLRWLEERTEGRFDPADGLLVDLATLRSGGSDAVQEAVAASCAKGRPAAVVVDAANDNDIAVIAAGLRRCFLAGLPFALRSAPPLAAALAGRAASSFVPLPSGCGRALVVAGSYVPTTTRQLAEFNKSYPGVTIVADIDALIESPESERDRLGNAVLDAWHRARVAAVMTPRGVPADKSLLDRGLRVAEGLARTVASLEPAPDVVIAKGGVTSAVVASRLGPPTAWVVGPVVRGVALWDLGASARTRWLVVFAGNVGEDSTLSDLVATVTSA
jgi:uncharacterized protein YgbK (DUF1537 family)